MGDQRTVVRGLTTNETEDAIYGFFGKYRFLSNFYDAPVVWREHNFPTVEHAFQAAKVPDHLPIYLSHFTRLKTAAAAKQFGRKVPLRSDWHQIKFSVMEQLLQQKFAQGRPLHDKLQQTAPKVLYELNNWGDRVWGVERDSHGRLVGDNNLGKLLIKIRDKS